MEVTVSVSEPVTVFVTWLAEAILLESWGQLDRQMSLQRTVLGLGAEVVQLKGVGERVADSLEDGLLSTNPS